MSSFTQPLTVTKIGSRLWRVERSFTYYLGSEENPSGKITVPKGFITDFASVPRAFWWLFPPDGQYTQAAVLHDYLYFKAFSSRKWADEIFYEAMGVLEVPWWKRKLMYRAVRLFGWIPWRNKKR